MAQQPSDQAAPKAADPPAPSSLPHPDATTPIPPQIITLTKSHLRRAHPSDAPAMAREANSPAVAKYMTLRWASPYTLNDAHRWIAYATAFRVPTTTNTTTTPDGNTTTTVEVVPSMQICDPATNTCLGSIGIKTKDDIEARCFEVAYWLGEGSWGRGIMTEVLPAYVGWLFETFPDVIRLQASVFEGNDASVRLLKTAGFVHEGTKRKAGVKGGWVFDILVFGLLREEWSLS
ncbi:acyl-CoA N-acyltransferase [Parathielavia hyrcaniae]|uniref:Acyl-CoA N-acyltransferase n=1 Tax=Parathielavia hyrcaniae TaxID=113614 RepID=A0AAN6T684_9PEZI|nr:acyl-CoA N-acyltransferase [Parathielavia hyrcaniae]